MKLHDFLNLYTDHFSGSAEQTVRRGLMPGSRLEQLRLNIPPTFTEVPWGIGHTLVVWVSWMDLAVIVYLDNQVTVSQHKDSEAFSTFLKACEQSFRIRGAMPEALTPESKKRVNHGQ